MEFLLNHGFVVFIDVEVEILTKRVLQQKGERPLVQSEQYEEVYQTLYNRLIQRRPIYEKAHLTLKGEIELDKVIENIIQNIN
jgi:shikimate kinase